MDHDLDKKIERYYDNNLDNSKESLELKETLDKMNSIDGIEGKISLNIDVNSLITKAEDIKIKKATMSFIIVAVIFALSMFVLALKYSLQIVFVGQILLGMLMLISYVIVKKYRFKEEIE